MLKIGATELLHSLSHLPERLKQFNISLELMIDDRLQGKLEEQEKCIESFLAESQNKQVRFSNLVLSLSSFSPPTSIYVNKLLAKVQKLRLESTKLTLPDHLKTVIARERLRLTNNNVTSLALEHGSSIELGSVTFNNLQSLVV